MSRGQITDYGFDWGPVEVSRVMHVEGGGYVVQVKAAGGSVQVYISEKGRSVRAWKGDEEMLTPGRY